jgi:hypothetical protein
VGGFLAKEESLRHCGKHRPLNHSTYGPFKLRREPATPAIHAKEVGSARSAPQVGSQESASISGVTDWSSPVWREDPGTGQGRQKKGVRLRKEWSEVVQLPV